MAGKREALDIDADGIMKYKLLPMISTALSRQGTTSDGLQRHPVAALETCREAFMQKEQLGQVTLEEKWQLECDIADETLSACWIPDRVFPEILVVATAKLEASRRVVPNEGISIWTGIRTPSIVMCRGEHAKTCYLERNERELCGKIRDEVTHPCIYLAATHLTDVWVPEPDNDTYSLVEGRPLEKSKGPSTADERKSQIVDLVDSHGSKTIKDAQANGSEESNDTYSQSAEKTSHVRSCEKKSTSPHDGSITEGQVTERLVDFFEDEILPNSKVWLDLEARETQGFNAWLNRRLE
ncbi:hypothetical protein BDZ45DRAFT_735010 [Acephala macrosclerotiorum]|nr:hypothetical protein BDZ45DRAFT_735010 [Acephala macrosclerotiorum]